MKDSFSKLLLKFYNDRFIFTLLKILLILLIILVVSILLPQINMFISKIRIILMPFLIGFALAYILRPLIVFLENKGVKRNFSIPVILVTLIVVFVLLITSVLPTLYTDLMNFIKSVSESIKYVYEWYIENSENPSELFKGITDNIVLFINNNLTPYFTNLITVFIGSFLNIITVGSLSLVSAIYIMFDYERITVGMVKLAGKINSKLPKYVFGVDKEVSVYIRTLILLMVLKAIEHSIIYWMIGHHNWLVLGILTGIGLIVPYIGVMSVHFIGILTALSLPLPNVIGLILGLMFLTVLDDYFVTPTVNSKKNNVHPLWSLFSVLVGGVMFGGIGIIVAVPVYMSIRAIITIYYDKEKKNEEV